METKKRYHYHVIVETDIDTTETVINRIAKKLFNKEKVSEYFLEDIEIVQGDE